VEALATVVNAEMVAGEFTRDRYRHFFPQGSRAAQFREELAAVEAQTRAIIPTLRTYADRVWLPRQQPPLVRVSYQRDARQHLRRYVLDVKIGTVVLGDLRLPDLTSAHVEELRAYWLRFGVGLKTLQNAIGGTLRALLRDAQRIDKLIPSNPVEALAWPRRKPTAPDPLTDDERYRVLAYFRDERPIYYPFIAVLLLTGMRPSEAAGLRWSDIDLDRGTIEIRRSRVLWAEAAPKTAGSERTIRMTPELREVLRALAPECSDLSVHVFRGRDGHPLHQDRVTQRHWRPALEALKIRRRDLYSCRHTFISLALTAGVNIKWLAEYCGTSVVMIERRYGRFMAPTEDQLSRLPGTAPAPHARGENRDPTRRSRVRRGKTHEKSRVSEGARTLNPWSHSPVLYH